MTTWADAGWQRVRDKRDHKGAQLLHMAQDLSLCSEQQTPRRATSQVLRPLDRSVEASYIFIRRKMAVGSELTEN